MPAEPKDSDEKSGNAEYAKHKQQNYLSKVTLHETTKPCPRCRVPIEKNFGLVVFSLFFCLTTTVYLYLIFL